MNSPHRVPHQHLSPTRKRGNELRSTSIPWLALQASVIVLIAACLPARADEPPGSPGPQVVIEETLPLMRTAEARLAEGRLDDETRGLQKQIVQNLEKLLQLAQQQAAQRPEASAEEQPSDAAGQSSAAGGTGEERRQSSDAGESSEEDRPGEGLSDVEIQRRRALATAVWGHLPPRLRDKLHGAFSERFLPQYDELVRKYYEALATQGEEEP